jgi:dienelactone hydrolase
MQDPSHLARIACALSCLALVPVALAQERVKLTAKDGHVLEATLSKPAGAPKGGVVLLPAAKGARIAFDPLLPRLAQAGILAAAIEPRYEAAVESAASRPAEPSKARLDLEAALALLAERGASPDKMAVVGAGAGAIAALDAGWRGERRLKALVLLSPALDEPFPSRSGAPDGPGPRILAITTADEAGKRPKPLEDLVPGAEVQTLEDRLASGTGMFGRVTGIESSIADWLDRALAQVAPIDIVESKLVLIDGDPAPNEATGATTIQVPISDSASATVRLTRSKKALEIGFDVPEQYVRLNEVVVYVDSSGRGSRIVDNSCYRISLNPKNPARKPLLVQRGGLKGFEDTDDKGVVAHAHTEQKRRWTAEISLDFSRFVPGDFPKSCRLAFQINGHRLSDVRYYPDDAKVPTSPGAWALARLK